MKNVHLILSCLTYFENGGAYVFVKWIFISFYLMELQMKNYEHSKIGPF